LVSVGGSDRLKVVARELMVDLDITPAP